MISVVVQQLRGSNVRAAFTNFIQTGSYSDIYYEKVYAVTV